MEHIQFLTNHLFGRYQRFSNTQLHKIQKYLCRFMDDICSLKMSTEVGDYTRYYVMDESPNITIHPKVCPYAAIALDVEKNIVAIVGNSFSFEMNAKWIQDVVRELAMLRVQILIFDNENTKELFDPFGTFFNYNLVVDKFNKFTPTSNIMDLAYKYWESAKFDVDLDDYWKYEHFEQVMHYIRNLKFADFLVEDMQMELGLLIWRIDHQLKSLDKIIQIEDKSFHKINCCYVFADPNDDLPCSCECMKGSPLPEFYKLDKQNEYPTINFKNTSTAFLLMDDKSVVVIGNSFWFEMDIEEYSWKDLVIEELEKFQITKVFVNTEVVKEMFESNFDVDICRDEDLEYSLDTKEYSLVKTALLFWQKISE